MIKKALILSLLFFTVISCNKEQYQLKWKIPAGEVLIYSIQMETIDSLSSVTEDNLHVLVDMVAKMYGDTVTVPVTTKDLYQGLVRQLNMLAYFSILRQGTDNDVQINFVTKQINEYEQIKYLDIFRKFIRKAVFKGSLSASGNLANEDEEQVFDPKINILFELPEKPVSIGDSWSLNIKPPTEMIKKGGNDSIKNTVTFKDLEIKDGDSVAIIEYQLQSPDKSGNSISFTGKGRFSISQGKWIEYLGMLSQTSSGLLPMNHVQKIKLTEISAETYKALIKKAQKSDLFEDKGEVGLSSEMIKQDTVVKETKPLKSDCPIHYRVQVLATQQPIQNKQSEFKKLPFAVEEIVLNANDKFKYKYTVGNECTMEKARLLLAQVQKSGYPKAYVIKTH